MSTAGRVRVDSPDALDALMSVRALTRFFIPRIDITAAGLPEAALRERQDRLDRLTEACGCGEGSAAALAGLGLYLAYTLSIGSQLGAWGQTWRCLIVTLTAATVGKVVGLARARVLLYGELADLRRFFPPSFESIGS